MISGSMSEMTRRMAAALTLMLIAAVAIAAAPAAAPAAKPKPKHTPPAKIEPPMGAWKTDISKGIQGTISKEKPSLVMISAAWCPYCKKQKNEILPNAAVQESLKNWDLTYIDLDTYPATGKELQTKVIPYFVMFDRNGQELNRFNHETNSEQVKAWLDFVYPLAMDLQKIDDQLKSNPNDAKLLGAKADKMMDVSLKMHTLIPNMIGPMAQRLTRCLDAYKQAAAAGNSDPELKAKAEMVELVIPILNGQVDPSAPQMAEFVKKHEGSPLAGDACFFQAVAAMKKKPASPLVASEPTSDQMFKTYVEKYPTGRYADTAQRRLKIVKAAQEKAKAKAAGQPVAASH